MNPQEKLRESCQRLGIELSVQQEEQFMLYMDLLLQWNQKMNLTAITDTGEIITKHFVDSISMLKGISLKEGSSIIDVGTGAGFPGIPLKIVCPSLQVTLLDSLQKRIVFLEEVVHQLELKNVCCVHSRAEDGGQNPLYREQFDYCVSRAVARLSVLAEYTIPFIKVNGMLICLKGPEAQNELSESAEALQILGAGNGTIQEIEIPFSDLRHKMIMVEKLSHTSPQYPRKAGKITKKPL